MSKISPLYSAVVDLFDTHHSTVTKHHKTGNKIHIWAHLDTYNRNYASELKATLTEYFKQLLGFFTSANVQIVENEGNNFKIVVQVPKDHLTKLGTIEPDELNVAKAEVTDLVKSATTEMIADNITFRVNGSSRHVRVYSVPNELAGQYILKIYELFSAKGWTVSKVSSFSEGHTHSNIHFFYKKV